MPEAQADVLTPGALGGGLRLVVREFLEAVPRSQAQAASVSELSARVRAAHYFIGRGQVARAGAHLRNALYATHAKPPAEDQWAALMAEFDI